MTQIFDRFSLHCRVVIIETLTTTYFSHFLSPHFSLSRNVIYNLSIADLSEQHKIIWRASEDDTNMCNVKGKDEVKFTVDGIVSKAWNIFHSYTREINENENLEIAKMAKTHSYPTSRIVQRKTRRRLFDFSRAEPTSNHRSSTWNEDEMIFNLNMHSIIQNIQIFAIPSTLISHSCILISKIGKFSNFPRVLYYGNFETCFKLKDLCRHILVYISFVPWSGSRSRRSSHLFSHAKTLQVYVYRKTRNVFLFN